MKRFVISLLLILLFSTLSFGQEVTATSSQMQKVIKLHDEMMAKMPQFVPLIGQLESKMDGSEKDELYKITIADLKESNKAMADWMQGFGEKFTADEMYKGATLTDEKKQLLSEEETKVIALGEKIDTSLSNAKVVISGN